MNKCVLFDLVVGRSLDHGDQPESPQNAPR